MRVPRPIMELCTENVLVMEYVPGKTCSRNLNFPWFMSSPKPFNPSTLNPAVGIKLVEAVP